MTDICELSNHTNEKNNFLPCVNSLMQNDV